MAKQNPYLLYIFIALLIFIYIFYRIYQKKKIYDHILNTHYNFSLQNWDFMPKFSTITGREMIDWIYEKIGINANKEGLTNMTITNPGFNLPVIGNNSFKYFLIGNIGTHTDIIPGWTYYADSGNIAIVRGQNAFTARVPTPQALAFQAGKTQYIEQELTLNPGQYTVSVSALGRPGTRLYNPAHNFQIVFESFMSPIYNALYTGGWRTYSFTFEIPSRKTPIKDKLKFIFKSPIPGDTTIFITNVALTQIKENPIIVEQPTVVNTTINNSTPTSGDTTTGITMSTTTGNTTGTTMSTTPNGTSTGTTYSSNSTTDTTQPSNTTTNTNKTNTTVEVQPYKMPSITSVMTEEQANKIIKNEVNSEMVTIKKDVKNQVSNKLDPINFSSVTKYILTNPNNTDTSAILETLKSQVKEEFVLEKQAYNKKKREEYEKQSNFSNPNNLPLKEYAIKSSLNSAYDGKQISLDALKQTILNGYRFIDLHIFEGLDDNLYVGFSDDKDTTLIDSTLPLHKALNYISTYAFSKDRNFKIQDSDSPNIYEVYQNYPLFLNFRFHQRKTGQRENKNNADIIGKLYNDYFKSDGIFSTNVLLKDGEKAKQINSATRLSELKGKILIVMDINNILKYYSKTNNANEVPNSTKEILEKLVNIKTGGHTWKSFYNYSNINNMEQYPLFNKDHEFETNTKNLYIIYPSSNNQNNPDAMLFMKNYKIQTIPVRSYIKDSNMETYTNIYNFYKMPFVPMRNILIYGNQ